MGDILAGNVACGAISTEMYNLSTFGLLSRRKLLRTFRRVICIGFVWLTICVDKHGEHYSTFQWAGIFQLWLL